MTPPFGTVSYRQLIMCPIMLALTDPPMADSLVLLKQVKEP
jgi:hypothetical protein